MPVTPYHFGPSGLIGYVFRKWIDFPVFVLANVVVDFEVLIVAYFNLGRPCHRFAHTFIAGAAVGIAWGIIAYFILPALKWSMKKMRISYQTNFLKMVISGILGVWLHVFIDAIYHFDVKPFWPMRRNPLWRLLSQSQVRWICVICLLVFLLLYVLSLKKQLSRKD